MPLATLAQCRTLSLAIREPRSSHAGAILFATHPASFIEAKADTLNVIVSGPLAVTEQARQPCRRRCS